MSLTLSDHRRSSAFYSVPSVVKNLGENPPPTRIATSHSIKIRATQIKPAPRTAQLAPDLLQFGRTVRTEPLRMSRTAPRPRFRPFHFGSICSLVFLFLAHPRNIPPSPPARKWKTIFLSRFALVALLLPYFRNRLPAKFFLFYSQIFPASTDPFALKCFCT